MTSGCERFSQYKGYADSFQWDGDYIDATPRYFTFWGEVEWGWGCCCLLVSFGPSNMLVYLRDGGGGVF